MGLSITSLECCFVPAKPSSSFRLTRECLWRREAALHFFRMRERVNRNFLKGYMPDCSAESFAGIIVKEGEGRRVGISLNFKAVVHLDLNILRQVSSEF